MRELRNKHLWMTDTHLLPWQRFKMLGSILDERPQGVFCTGDISNFGFTIKSDLEFLARRVGRPFYFVLGNHDYWFSSINDVNEIVRKLCKRYKNLVWLTESDVISLNEEAAIIGAEGWYDVRVGNPQYIKYTFDWFLTKDFKKLKNMDERINEFRKLAIQSATLLTSKLSKAIEDHKTVYLLTHFPPWPEANRCNGWISEAFWEPYNTNLYLGRELEKVMENHKKRNLIVLSGHTHSPVQIHVSRNIQCFVGRGAYHKLMEDEVIYI